MVQIKSPGDKTTVDKGKIEIKGKIASVASIKTTKIYINGTDVKTLDGNISEFNESYEFNEEGVYQIKVRSWNEKDKDGDSVVKIGVNKPWDSPTSPTVTPSPTP